MDIEQRKAYLNSMREKLQASRRGGRAKQLQSPREPIREAWQNQPPEATQDVPTVNQDSDLQRARLLAESLRREVVDAKNNEK